MKTFVYTLLAVLCLFSIENGLVAQNGGNVSLRYEKGDVNITGDGQRNAVRVETTKLSGNASMLFVRGLFGTRVNGKSMVSALIYDLDDLHISMIGTENRIYVDEYIGQTSHAKISVTGGDANFVQTRRCKVAELFVSEATFINAMTIISTSARHFTAPI